MKTKASYLSGRSVFIVSLIVISLTALTVYISGIHSYRSLTSNFYLSLGIIGCCLFLFITYGLITGVQLIDDYRDAGARTDSPLVIPSSELPKLPGFPALEFEEGPGGWITGILLWILFSIALFILLLFWEVLFWYSLVLIMSMLYWVFFRALKLVFNKAPITQGKLGLSILYSLSYTFVYTGWMFGLLYLVEVLR